MSNILNVVIKSWWRNTESVCKEGCIGMQGRKELVHGFALSGEALQTLFVFMTLMSGALTFSKKQFNPETF